MSQPAKKTAAETREQLAAARKVVANLEHEHREAVSREATERTKKQPLRLHPRSAAARF